MSGTAMIVPSIAQTSDLGRVPTAKHDT